MLSFERLEEKIKVSRQMINDALDRLSVIKIPESKLVELIQINGFFDLLLRNEPGHTADEINRIEAMMKRMEEILISIKEENKSKNHTTI